MFQITTIEPGHILVICVLWTVFADLNFYLPTEVHPALTGYQFINQFLIHIVDGSW